MHKTLSVTLGLLTTLSLLTTANDSRAAEITIQEWPVPWENTRPRDPFVAPDGRVWFVGQAGHYAAVFDPGTETFTRIDMDDGTGPHNLIVDGDGIVWYAGNRAAHIGRLDPGAPGGEQIKKYPTPQDTAADPHTLIEADNGMIWFTAQQSNGIGCFDPATGEVRMLSVPTSRARPYGIDLDGQGNPWVVLLGTNKLARVDAEAFTLEEIEMPRAATRPRRIAISSDDLIWYVDYAEGYLGHYNPETKTFKEWPTPGRQAEGLRGSGPYAMAIDAQDRIWLVETFPAPNRLVGFDPASETFISETAIPSGAGSVRHMYYDTRTNSIWFGTDANTLGKAQLPD